MKTKKIICLALSLWALLCLQTQVSAAQVESGEVYCFTQQDFSQQDGLQGICITALPAPETGTMILGNRVLQAGDILTVEQIAQMTFHSLNTQTDVQAQVEYLPIYENRVERQTVMTLSVLGKTDKAPVAEDFTVETYKNLPNEGKLKVTDPEGQKLTYTVLRKPRRGEVTVHEDGSFVYTPKKNKVGVDSFTYTATDPAGNVSREATVSIQILKPSDARQYTDTALTDCRFEAEWLRNTGIFTAERIGGQDCFQPEKTVSRGEFLTMAVKTLDIAPQEGSLPSWGEDAPQWLRPYLAAALRSGLITTEQQTMDTAAPITAAEAAVLLQNVLQLPVQEGMLETFAEEEPTREQEALAVMAPYGLPAAADTVLTRADVAKLLYQVSRLAATAPGLKVFW